VSLKKKVLFRFGAIALGLLFCEVVLCLAAIVFPTLSYYLRPNWGRSVCVPDDQFGHRMTASYPGNDRRGFRNPKSLDECEVLAIGDSMTFGYAAPADKCWPRQLERLTGKSVYNMSCGDYSPCEYLMLLDEGLELSPDTVIFCLYLGNDLANSYRTVHVHHRAQQFNDAHEQTLSEFILAEKAKPFLPPPNPLKQHAPQQPKSLSVRRLVSKYSALYGVLRFAKDSLQKRHFMPLGENADNGSVRSFYDDPSLVIYDDESSLATAFGDPEYYGMAMDLDDPRIAEGWEITKAVLESAKRKSEEKEARFVVAIIPTKHSVYADLVRDSNPDVPSAFFELVAYEDRVGADVEDFLNEIDVDFVDTRDALRTCFDSLRRPYPPTTNTHPNADGYAAIARVIAEVIEPRISDDSKN